ncbi:MAG TPA: glycosyltransferase [Candidatus Latescibacteria bacterium]|nr:glycosyltransferase [Candidatus Latescibacterota bacterium]HOS64362.1 glycosyltransferase [Candidatus Latescibacterota bacterium]HPK75779.1 glycosyltransferase [Candidatus Latescibacterota bacterium]
MRILCVGRRLTGGGAERAQLNFLNELARRGAAYEAIYLKSGGALAESVTQPEKLSFITGPDASLWPRLPQILRVLWNAARRADVVFAMQEGTPIYLAAIAARLAGKPCVAWNHGLLEDAFFGWHKMVMPVLYRLPHTFICITEAQANQWSKVIPAVKARSRVVQVPVEIARIRSMAERSPTVGDSEGTTLTVLGYGRLAYQKRFDLLIRAAAVLRERRQDFAVTILGSGPEEQMLRQLTNELGLNSVVTFVPFDPNPFSHVARSDVVVVPSRWENFGTVASEALALGKPVVATTSWTAFPEVLGSDSDGLGIITEDTPEALAEGINTALNMPEDGEVISRRKRRAECFDTGIITDRILDVLRSVTTTAR